MKATDFTFLTKYVGAAAFSFLAAVPKAAAQSCAMCYQNAAASGTQGRFALQHGILILFIPAIGLFSGILFLLYSRRHVSDRAASLPDEGRSHRTAIVSLISGSAAMNSPSEKI
jgi:hypothetical protein